MSHYKSPRWSNEILDCSMPMTFDTYNKCSYNCLYCFSFFQKSNRPYQKTLGKRDYQKTDLKWVDIRAIKNLFLLKYKDKRPDQAGLWQFNEIVRRRMYFQWGGLADPFDEYERRHGKSLELLEFFRKIKYPICFSTKAVWWLYDDRYLKVFKGMDNWNVKFSIINLNKETAKKIELGCPSPEKRLEAIKEYTKLNKGGATLRLRPFIIGMSDVNGEYLELIRRAKGKGASAVSTEFFCLEARADQRLRDRYDRMSQVLGMDIWDFYRSGTPGGTGYRRLTYSMKKPYIKAMDALCRKLGLRFYVSDAHHKEKCFNGSCCGLDDKCNYSHGQFTEALLIAKRRGKVYFSNISKHLQMYKRFKWRYSEGLNTRGTMQRTAMTELTMYDFIRNAWNDPNAQVSPYKYFGGILYPIGLDKNEDVIYEYRGE